MLFERALLAPAEFRSKDLESRRARFREAIAARWQYQLKTHPEFATYVGDPRYNDRLSDFSPQAVAAEDEETRRQLALFTAIDSTGFSPEELLDKELMVRDLRQAIEETQLKLWEMPVNQMNGIHMDLAWMPAQMPFNTVKDYDNYIARLHAVPRALSQTMDVMRLGLRDRLMPPRYLLEKVGRAGAGHRERCARAESVCETAREVSRCDPRSRSTTPAQGDRWRRSSAR